VEGLHRAERAVLRAVAASNIVVGSAHLRLGCALLFLVGSCQPSAFSRLGSREPQASSWELLFFPSTGSSITIRD